MQKFHRDNWGLTYNLQQSILLMMVKVHRIQNEKLVNDLYHKKWLSPDNQSSINLKSNTMKKLDAKV